MSTKQREWTAKQAKYIRDRWDGVPVEMVDPTRDEGTTRACHRGEFGVGVLYTVTEAASMVGCTNRNIFYLCSRGQANPVRVDGLVRFDLSEINRLRALRGKAALS